MPVRDNYEIRSDTRPLTQAGRELYVRVQQYNQRWLIRIFDAGGSDCVMVVVPLCLQSVPNVQ